MGLLDSFRRGREEQLAWDYHDVLSGLVVELNRRNEIERSLASAFRGVRHDGGDLRFTVRDDVAKLTAAYRRIERAEKKLVSLRAEAAGKTGLDQTLRRSVDALGFTKHVLSSLASLEKQVEELAPIPRPADLDRPCNGVRVPARPGAVDLAPQRSLTDAEFLGLQLSSRRESVTQLTAERAELTAKIEAGEEQQIREFAANYPGDPELAQHIAGLAGYSSRRLREVEKSLARASRSVEKLERRASESSVDVEQAYAAWCLAEGYVEGSIIKPSLSPLDAPAALIGSDTPSVSLER